MPSPSTRRPLARPFATALIAAAFATPGLALAQEPTEPSGKPLEEYLREQLEGGELRDTVRQFLKAFEPVAKELDQMIREMPQYEQPEILPNGDIIIRRKRDGSEIET